ncbi:glycosyltransferase family 9 protein [Flavihumibacter sp. ZG627]|uniref:glycosyltransferase family 9 protein n=1 Tax=Flavihumibacter sp. ZG627 TaxID=1463156 RepID=UPI00057DBCF8|nr:hypothetical protein [Flavihumibacter sp. ZG627]KIC91801.1 hypothetical protein HY58_06195 [Flavihumibacter sp. ZG627]
MTQKRKILVIKTGAAGDVVRTTSVLNLFKDDSVVWLTSEPYIAFFQDLDQEIGVFDINNYPDKILSDVYDLVLSQEEEADCAKLASSLNTKKLVGVYWDNGIKYTNDSNPWLDMSLISPLGKEAANELKKVNPYSFQELFFQSLGVQFNGQPYQIYQPPVERNKRRVGIEKTAGARWAYKQWHGYEALGNQLEKEGFEVIYFEKREDIRDYLREINSCGFVLSGDTLAMHIALAYGIPGIAIFNCTSPTEIYDYNLLLKIVNPKLNDYFYSTGNDPEVSKIIPFETVYNAFKQHYGKFYPTLIQTGDTVSS